MSKSCNAQSLSVERTHDTSDVYSSQKHLLPDASQAMLVLLLARQQAVGLLYAGGQ